MPARWANGYVLPPVTLEHNHGYRGVIGRLSMKRHLVVTAAVALLVAYHPHADAKRCRKGIPCGNSCISASKTCRIGQPTYRASSPRHQAPNRVYPAAAVAAPSPPVSAPTPPPSAPSEKIALRAYPSPDAPITGHFSPGQEFSVFGSAGDWILISPLSAPKHQWMLLHGAR